TPAAPTMRAAAVAMTMVRFDSPLPRLRGSDRVVADCVITLVSWDLLANLIRRCRGVVTATERLECSDLAEQLVAIRVDFVELRLVPVAFRIEQIEITEGAAVVPELCELACACLRGHAAVLGLERLLPDVEARIRLAQIDHRRGDRLAITGEFLVTARF